MIPDPETNEVPTPSEINESLNAEESKEEISTVLFKFFTIWPEIKEIGRIIIKRDDFGATTLVCDTRDKHANGCIILVMIG